MKKRFAHWLVQVWIWLVWTIVMTGCAVEDLRLGYASRGDCRLDGNPCWLVVDSHYTEEERVELEWAVEEWEASAADAGYYLEIEVSYCELDALRLVNGGLSKGWDSPTRVDPEYVPPNVGGIVLYTSEIDRANGSYLQRLRMTAVHEIGHWLGLGHSGPDADGAMNPDAPSDIVTVRDIDALLAGQP